MAMLTFTFLRSLKFRLLVVPHLALFVFWGLYYGKRDVFAELAMLIVFFFIPWIMWSREKTSAKLTGVMLLMTLAGISFFLFAANPDTAELAGRIVGRFLTEISDVSQFDRLNETKEVMHTFDIFDFITGKGLGSSSEFAIGQHILHLGAANLVFKGGLLLALLVAGSLVVNILRAMLTPIPGRVFVFAISSYVLVKLTYSQLWGYFPIVMMLGIALLSRSVTRGFSRPVMANPHFSQMSGCNDA